MEKYSLLHDDGESETDLPVHRQPSHRWRKNWLRITIVGLTLVLSLSCNLILLVPLGFSRSSPSASVQLQGTPWAGLVRNVPVPIYSSTEYGPAIGSQEERDGRWGALDISPGTVALSDDFARQHGLPLSQRFPWDQSKGIYILGAFHQMHCLIKIQRYTSAAHRGAPEEEHLYSHVEHCLDSLLQDVYCHADDTPWYEVPPAPYRQNYAQYQTRQCKNWDRLVDWAAQYNACYKNDNVTDTQGRDVESEFEHYTFCPEGSPWTPIMQKYYETHEIQRTGYHVS